MRFGLPSTRLVRPSVLGLVAALLLPVGAVARSDAAPHAPSPSVGVIVRETAPLTSHAERAVRRHGGTVTRQLPIVGGFAATLPAAHVDALGAEKAIAGLW